MNLFNHFRTGHVTIGTTAAQLSPQNLLAHSIIRIKADATNTNDLFIGPNASVASTTGYRLDAGESVDLPLVNTDAIWIVGGAASQGYSYLVL